MEEMGLACETAAAEEVGTDEVAIIFSFLDPKDIMRARVCSSWRAAAMKTIVPSSLIVDSVRSYNAMRVMSTAMPNLQRISLQCLNGNGHGRHSYSNGDEPDEWYARQTANYITHDVNIISRFRRLRVLRIHEQLNGRYPILFDFPSLQHLCIKSKLLRWDLEVLVGLPQLKVLESISNPHMTGNLNSLKVLRGTLEIVRIVNCGNVRGNLMKLADFPQLKELNLFNTSVKGDIRDISVCDFPALKLLKLPKRVHGGSQYEFQRIAEVPDFMNAIHRLLQRTPTLFGEWKYILSHAFGWSLSGDSPDWYVSNNGLRDDNDSDRIHNLLYRLHPPLGLQCVRTGSRFGWRWCSSFNRGHSCEINWLDPEPIEGSDDYEVYARELQHVERWCVIYLFRGYFLSPPNLEDFRRLCEDYNY